MLCVFIEWVVQTTNTLLHHWCPNLYRKLIWPSCDNNGNLKEKDMTCKTKKRLKKEYLYLSLFFLGFFLVYGRFGVELGPT